MTLLPVFKNGVPLFRGSDSLVPAIAVDPCDCCGECTPGFCNSVQGTLSSSDEFQVVISGAVDQTVPAEASETGSECVLPMSEINGTWVLSYFSGCGWRYSDGGKVISVVFLEFSGDYYIVFNADGFGEDAECYISTTTADDCNPVGIGALITPVVCEGVEVIDFDEEFEFDTPWGYNLGPGNGCQTIHVVITKL